MGLVQLFALAKAAGRYAERTQTHHAALSVMGHMRAMVAQLLEPLIPTGLGPRSADVVERVLGDVTRVQDLLTTVAGPLASGLVAGVITIVVSGLIVPWSAALLLLGLLITTVLLPLGAQRLGAQAEHQLTLTRADVLDLFDRVMRAGEEYALNGATPQVARQLTALEDRYDAARRRSSRAAGVVTALTTMVAGLSTLGAALISAQALAHGAVSRTLIAVPALLAIAALDLVGGIAPAVTGLRGDRAALGRIEALVDRPRPVREPDDHGDEPRAPWDVGASAVSLDIDGHVLVEELSTRLQPGDFVVVSGRSGSGKTSVARLLAKFIDPTSGTLTLGDVDYRRLHSSEVRSRVGYVDDTPHVFATSVAGNLRIANIAATTDELLSVLDAVGLTRWLDELNDGLETPLGGGPAGLSGGEQRRLGLARELLCARPITILDEPTEGLDDATAVAVLDELRRRCCDGVLVIISHRVRGVGENRRLVVSGGAVTELPAEQPPSP